jgi:hypothetical protein
MKAPNRSVLLAVVITSALTAAQASASVIQGPVTYMGHQYYLLSQNTWAASEAEAVTLGGHLVTINDAAENAFVFDTFTANGTINRALWIGLTDQASEAGSNGANFVWISGDPSPFRNFASGEPNNGGPGGQDEDYVHMWYPSAPFPAGSWNDFANASVVAGNVPLHGVVETVSEPSALLLLGSGLAGLALRSRLRRGPGPAALRRRKE